MQEVEEKVTNDAKLKLISPNYDFIFIHLSL